MAHCANQSSSHIPLPTESSPILVSEIHMKELILGECLPTALEQTVRNHSKENGNIKIDRGHQNLTQSQKGNGFETFLMTGEMIINTNPSINQKFVKQVPEGKGMKESHIPRLGPNGPNQIHQKAKAHKQNAQKPDGKMSPKFHSKIPGPVKIHNSQQSPHLSSSYQNHSPPPENFIHVLATDFPLVQAPVAEMEELSDLSQSSSDDEPDIESDLPTQSPSLPANRRPEILTPTSAGLFRLEQAINTLGKLQSSLSDCNTAGRSNASFPESPNIGVDGDGDSLNSDHTNQMFNSSRCVLSKEGNSVSSSALTGRVTATANTDLEWFSTAQTVGTCQATNTSNSGEKFSVQGNNTEQRLLVRTSKSHENYLQAGTGIALVSIDIEDSLAYSLDTLAYNDSPDSSLDNVSEPLQMSRSLDNSPEKKEKASDREFIPGFINFEDSKTGKLKLPKQDNDENGEDEDENCQRKYSAESPSPPPSRFQFISHEKSDKKSSGDSSEHTHSPNGNLLQLCILSDDLDTDNLYHQPSKAVDKPSAERLAKRLFNLEGFRKSDVSRHLCKKNDFSNLVAEEYLKFFDFQEDTLDVALRKFLSRFSLYGETQERERVLAHFSHRFMECNTGSFNSEDACHTLTCAIMLLNSDLHSPNIPRRMTCQEFIENLADLNDGEDFYKEVLKGIYQAIKNEPIEWAIDDVSPEKECVNLPEQSGQILVTVPQVLCSNPFLEIPDPNRTTEYKKGYVMRKCCMEPNRRKTALGKRGWKMMYAVLQDMILYQYKDERQLKKGHFVESAHNTIRIHHALATKATDYIKKQHVFRLQTADWAEYLFQTGDSKELQEWVDTINLVAATLSAPALPGAVGSKTKFQRQILSASYTRFNLREQFLSHVSRIQELEQELHAHYAAAPEKGTKSSIIQEYLDRENYLEFETKRFKTYAYLLQGKLVASQGLEPSLVETAIGEHEEMETGPSRSYPAQPVMSAAKPSPFIRNVHRSMSDRYTYRAAAICQADQIEYDMV